MDEKSLTVSFDEKAEQKARNLNFAQLTKEEGPEETKLFHSFSLVLYHNQHPFCLVLLYDS